MTRLQIVIDRGADAKREECGRCRLLIEYADDWASGEPIRPDCSVFLDEDGDPIELVNDDDNPLRCPECLAAEVPGSGEAIEREAELRRIISKGDPCDDPEFARAELGELLRRQREGAE